jgi:hypothetical protein
MISTARTRQVGCQFGWLSSYVSFHINLMVNTGPSLCSLGRPAKAVGRRHVCAVRATIGYSSTLQLVCDRFRVRPTKIVSARVDIPV